MGYSVHVYVDPRMGNHLQAIYIMSVPNYSIHVYVDPWVRNYL